MDNCSARTNTVDVDINSFAYDYEAELAERFPMTAAFERAARGDGSYPAFHYSHSDAQAAGSREAGVLAAVEASSISRVQSASRLDDSGYLSALQSPMASVSPQRK